MIKQKNRKRLDAEFQLGNFLFTALSILLFSCAYLSLQAQTIAPYFFGQNAWMPNAIGSHTYSGTLTNHWQDVKSSNFVSVRIGGRGYDDNAPTFSPVSGPPTTPQLLALIDSIQINGGEPIVQIDYADGTYTSTDAANTVTAINVTNIGSIQRKVKYWIIGNEPDNYTTNKYAVKIAAYIKSYSTAMKGVTGQSDIKIIAPELSYYTVRGIMDSLIAYGGPDDITGLVPSQSYYYVDYISFHYYPFDSTQTRSQVISKIKSSGGFKENLDSLTSKLNTPNSHRSSSPLKIAITEGNIAWRNKWKNYLTGVGTNSYIAGQFWAEMMEYCMLNSVQFMNFWSVIEGSELGYLRSSDGSRRSTWYHFDMLAENFKGTFSDGTVTGASNFKSFGSYNSDQIAVLLMNQNTTSSLSYTVRLGTGTAGGTGTVKINIPGPGLTKEYTDNISNQSSTLLVFDHNGNISFKSNYGLSDSLSAPANSCSTPKTFADQSSLDAYTPGVYSSITIGGAGAITLSSTDNTIYKAVGTITIDGSGGAFSSGGQTLDLINTDCE